MDTLQFIMIFVICFVCFVFSFLLLLTCQKLKSAVKKSDGKKNSTDGHEETVNPINEFMKFTSDVLAVMADTIDFDRRVKNLLLTLARYYDSECVNLIFIGSSTDSKTVSCRLRKTTGGYEFDSGLDGDKLKKSKDFFKSNSIYVSDDAGGTLNHLFEDNSDYAHIAFNILHDGELWGILSFDSLKKDDSSYKYTDEFLDIIRNVFTATVEHYMSNKDLVLTKLYMDTIFHANKDANYLIVVTDENGILKKTNSSRLYTEEHIGQSIFEIGANIPPEERGLDDISLIKEKSGEAKTSGKTVRFKNNTRKGLYLDTTVYPVFNEQNKTVGVLYLAQNITEAVNLEKQLQLEQSNVKKASDRFEMAINAMNAGIMEYNFTGNKFSYNDTLKTLCDCSENSFPDLDKEILGRLLGNKTIDRIRNNCISMPDKSHVIDSEIVLKTGRNRSLRTYIYYVEEKNISDLSEAKLIGITIDHTLEFELGRKILAEKEKAESESAVKSEFISRIGYEIRTPMNAITGMVKISKRSRDIEKIQNCLDKIEISSNHLLAIIDDVLDISRFDTAEPAITNESFDFEEFIREIVDLASMQTENRRQDISVKINPDIPSKLYGDKMRLNQVILNLFSNAVKFTPHKGKIGLSVEIERMEEDDITLTFSVLDTGIGISEEKLQKLFKPNISGRFKDTGLGLMISKNIIDAMNGKIWAESKKGEGSKFSFTVTLKMDKGKSGLDIPENINNIKVLIIGQDEYSNEEMKLFLESFEFNHTFSDDIIAALEEIKKALSEGEPYSVIFIDWEMPDVDILELARKIIKVSSEKAIVLITNMYEYEEVKKQAHRLGIIKIVSKPMYPSVILDTILASTTGNLVTAEIDYKNEYNFKDVTILFAEDIDINIEVVKELLAPTNINIDVVYDGIDAVEAFRSNPLKYSLILMDVQMLDMDGYTATKEIRESNIPGAAEIPIIALTANSMHDNLAKEKASGMSNHLSKPINEREMLKMLKRYIRDDKKSEPISVNNFYSKKLAIEGINIEEGLSRIDNKINLYKRLLRNFKDANHIIDLKAYISCDDYRKALSECLAIKGITGNLGLTNLEDATVTLYDIVKDGTLKANGPEFNYYEHVYEETIISIDKILKYKGEL